MNQNKRAFTLIELMIVIVIVGILASIGYPSYTSYVQKSRRTDARVSLLDYTVSLEKRYTQLNRYPTAAEMGITASTKSSEGYYLISYTQTDDTYTLTATADASGPQKDDSSCLVLTIDQLGLRKGGAAAGSVSVGNCWE